MLLLALLVVVDTTEVHHIIVAPSESVSVSVAGEGAPVVLVPGLFGSAYAFRDLAPQLNASGFRTVIVEPLGIGASARPRGADYSLTAQAERVAAVMDSLAVHDAVVLAHSHGGSIAYRLAVLRPDLVAGIVAVEGGPAEQLASPGFRWAMRLAPVVKLFVGRQTVQRAVRDRLVQSSGDPSWVTEDVVRGYTVDAVADLGATMGALSGMADSPEPWSLAARLPEIECPVRLVLGGAAHTGAVPEQEVALLRSSLPRFAVDSVRGAGHFVFEEQPAPVVAAIERLERERIVAALGAPAAGLPH